MYREMQSVNIEDYIFNTLPYNGEINLQEIQRIEQSLRDFAEGHTSQGITYEEAFKFLDWMTYNARVAVVKGNNYENVMTEPLTGTCAITQEINTTIAEKVGLNAKPFNMGDCVGSTPMTEEDIRRIKNGWASTQLRHAVTMINIPIQINGVVQNHTYLLDPTVRQFCLKENCSKDLYFDQERIQKGYVAPHPAYFLTEEYLREQGASEEQIKQSEYVAKVLINRGYMELTEETAKIYGDAFAKSGIREQFKDTKLTMTGLDYIKEFAKGDSSLIRSSEYEKYKKTPLEAEKQKKKSLWGKIKDFFARKKQKSLPAPIETSTVEQKRINTLEGYKVDDYKYPDTGKIKQKSIVQDREIVE